MCQKRHADDSVYYITDGLGVGTADAVYAAKKLDVKQLVHEVDW